MAKFTEDELSRISEILTPLNRNPLITESLNPTAKTLRRIKGEPEPEIPEHDEDFVDPSKSTGSSEGGFEVDPDKTIEPPVFNDTIDNDDTDIDALLSGDMDTILGKKTDEEKAEEEFPEETFTPDVPDSLVTEDIPTEETPDTFDFGDDLTGKEEGTPETDPFNFDQDFTDENKKDESPVEEPFDFGDEPFGKDETAKTDDTSADPFADINSDNDPFAFDKEDKKDQGDIDPFADGGDDPFSAVSEKTPEADFDPFADMGDTDTTPEEVKSETDIPDFNDIDDGFHSDSSISGTDSTDKWGDIDDDFSSLANIDAGTNKRPETFPITEEESTDIFNGFENTSEPERTDFTYEPQDSIPNFTDTESEDHGDVDHFADFSPSKATFDEGIDTDESPSLGQLDSEDSYDSGDFTDDDFSGIGEEPAKEQELSDEELAVIQQEILHYPPKLKRTIISAITSEELNGKEKTDLLDLIKTQQKPEDIAQYLSERLGRPVELYDSSGLYSEKGIPIIASDPIFTKQGEYERRQYIKRLALAAAAGVLAITGLITGYKYAYKPLMAASHYKDGIEQIKKAGFESDREERKKKLDRAELSFQKGEKINPNDLEYLNQYGMAYLKIGEYDKSFEKLFGKVDADFGAETDARKTSWTERTDVPYIEFAKGSSWDNAKLEMAGRSFEMRDALKLDLLKLTAQDKRERTIQKAGAYIVSRLYYKKHDNETYINLGKFHSFSTGDEKYRLKYKNDALAANYFKLVFTDGGDPVNVEATAGLAKMYYNQGNFGKAASYYNKIIEAHPKNPIGHGGLLSTYIEMWRKDRNPQFVLNHHRIVRNDLSIEDDLSLFTLTKLAAFYIDLDPTEIRIKYNVTPEDQVSNMDIDDNILHILNIAFKKSEKQDGVEVKGDEYAEQYYQRGRYYIEKNESMRALKQFELAANYDPAHYLAIMEMAEHYMRIDNNVEADKLLSNALMRYNAYSKKFGNKEEDETLIRGDVGRIYFNQGKIVYLRSALLNSSDRIDEFPARKVYPEKSLGNMTDIEKERRGELNSAMKFFDEALKANLQDQSKKRELYYYTAWINYMNSEYETALSSLANMGEEDTLTNPNVMLARANSFYYTEQLNASLGNYLKIKEDFEEKEAAISLPVPEESNHQEIYQTLIAVYNNIGAIYERKGNTAQALKHYWKSIETARKINTVTEIANYNKDLSFKGTSDKIPLLDDWLSPTVDTIRDLKKSKRKNAWL
ncbi:MAG TPA: tetratricopeptide repeat protein [Leptospiraceae bacterium]|nr:tetratricopeptide repeat protein [Leptospiraceae bacterium]HMY65188.1 tetratricopeptide repeat protein [Leptospiraceae bacterium]HNF12670.1 tetratricopeptide repeat protein [Leptospiraceae bacterium]HNO23217.1 tetratricopeptide repeat protein [Leptospiraceae bacterium]